MAELRADPGLVAELISELSEIGRTDSGGLTRPGLTNLERWAMEVVRSRLEELGCLTHYDAARNLRASWDPDGNGGPAVMTGSHLDSVVEGGHYDGPAGVVAAVAALSAMQEADVVPSHPIEVVVWTSEEGSRFGAGLLGSTAVVRGLTDEQLARTDPDGISVAEAVTAAGGDPEALRSPQLQSGDVRAFIEVHIEQGTVLEEAGAAVGVVSGIAAPVFLRGTVTGVADHAGATPMDGRHDALLGVSEVALAAERIALESESGGGGGGRGPRAAGRAARRGRAAPWARAARPGRSFDRSGWRHGRSRRPG
jgi:allantoate deiminase